MSSHSAGGFTLVDSAIALPQGAWARAHRRMLFHEGRPLLGLTQGRFRPCLFPVFSPQGFLVTSESPADHPHHNSLWIAADHVHAHMPVAGGTETYTYNFYVDETFQGRAPGRLVETGCTLKPAGPDAATITQTIDWRGPSEWAAPDGRLVLYEVRATTVRLATTHTLIDVTSTLSSRDWAVSLGPTRHAYFNARLSEAMLHGLVITDDRGPAAVRLPAVADASWVDATGPVGGGNLAGIAVMPAPLQGAPPTWFVTDWGVITAGCVRATGRHLPRGESLVSRCRFVVHDGALPAADLAALHRDFLAEST